MPQNSINVLGRQQRRQTFKLILGCFLSVRMVVAMIYNQIQHFISYLIQLPVKTIKYSSSSLMLKKKKHSSG